MFIKVINFYLMLSIISFYILADYINFLQELSDTIRCGGDLGEVKILGIVLDNDELIECIDDIEGVINEYDELTNTIIDGGAVSFFKIILLMPILGILLLFTLIKWYFENRKKSKKC